MHSSKKFKRDQEDNEDMENKCSAFHAETEESNSDKQKDDNTMDEDPGSSGLTEKLNSDKKIDDNTMDEDSSSSMQTSANCTKNRKDILKKSIVKVHEFSMDVKENDKQSENNACIDDYECYTCEERFPTQIDLDRHLLDCENDYLYVCAQCKTKHSEEDWEQHLETHKTTIVEHDCEICTEGFDTETEMDKHLDHCVSIMYPYLCLRCNEAFAEEELVGHEESHKTVKYVTPPFPHYPERKNNCNCDVCTKYDDNYTCSERPERFYTIAELKRYIYKEEFQRYRKEYPFLCWCAERFKRNKDFETHLRGCPSRPSDYKFPKKLNNNKENDDTMKKEGPDTFIQASTNCNEKKEDIPKKCIAKGSESNMDVEENVK